METKIEKERKWLLKKIPRREDLEKEYKFIRQITISQFYYNNFRFRKEWYKDTNETKYIKLKKESIGLGINKEVDIEEISEKEYKSIIKFIDSQEVIYKNRYIYKDTNNNLNLEIDIFYETLDLYILEIEDLEISDNIKFLPYLNSCILKEVTGDKDFNNLNLIKKDDKI